MTYDQILSSTYGKYSPAGGAATAPIIPIPVEPENPIKTEFTITDKVTFSNGGTGRHVSATLSGPDLAGIERYDDGQRTGGAKITINTGTQTTQMWAGVALYDCTIYLNMDFSQVENPDSLTNDSFVLNVNLTWDEGGSKEDVTIYMNGDIILPSGEQRNYMCFENIEQTDNTITLEKVGNPSEEVVCYYSFNKSTWTIIRTDIEGSGTCVSITLEPNQKVYLKGIGTWIQEGSLSSGFSQYVFQSTGRINLSGNILSIWNYNNFDELTAMPKNTSMRMFRKATTDGTTVTYSYLKIVNADLSFDNIAKVEQTSYTKPNASLMYSLFAATQDSPNTYLQTCKLGFNSGVNIVAVNGNTGARSPFSNFFSHCKSLKEVWIPNWSGTGTWNQNKWLEGITTTGTIYLPQGKNMTTGVNGCPTGWTKVYYNPTTGEIIENN